MKKLSYLVPILFLGCANLTTETTTIDPKTEVAVTKKVKITSFLSKSAFEGFEAVKESKTSSSLMSIRKGGTETETEKLAILLESIVSGAVKGAK